jgi:hypothetical protein
MSPSRHQIKGGAPKRLVVPRGRQHQQQNQHSAGKVSPRHQRDGHVQEETTVA